MDCPCCGKDAIMTTCPDCNGIGVYHYALDVYSGNSVQVTQAAYSLLPATEDEAIKRGNRYYKWGAEICQRCNGEGEIEMEVF